MIALIDGDVVAQRAAFAAEKTHYKVYIAGEIEEGGVVHTALSKDELNTWLEASGKPEDYFIVEREKVYAPLDTSIMAAKAIMESILNTLGCSEYKLYIKGTGNFRYDIATIKPYKGNRDPSARPKYIDDVYKYLERQWDAVKVDAMEVDDRLGIKQYTWFKMTYPTYGKDGQSTIICSIDKDLNMIPGWHYNFVTNERYWIDELEAVRNFYRQCIQGDHTDNVPGLYNITGKRYTKELSKIFEGIKTTKEMDAFVLEQYKGHEKELDEIKQLLWIKREENEVGPETPMATEDTQGC